MFNIRRLELARKRLQLSAKELAARANLSPVTYSRICKEKHVPDENTILKLIAVLGFPRSFFEKDFGDSINQEAVSFRSLSAMTARQRDAAISSGELAYELSDWMDNHYALPPVELPDLREFGSPRHAARALRQSWTIGERPIGHLIKLLEAKGIKIFSLVEPTKNLDGFSVWRGQKPYIFLNTFKTAERSRFDAAHELGHLVLHRHGGSHYGDAEKDANEFASEFLMPEADVRSHISFVRSLDQLISEKRRWGVSLIALCYRLHKLGLISDWQYRIFCIQNNQKYKTSEPNGMPKERSVIWSMILQDLWHSGIDKGKIASELHIPLEELESLIFGLTDEQERPQRSRVAFHIVK